MRADKESLLWCLVWEGRQCKWPGLTVLRKCYVSGGQIGIQGKHGSPKHKLDPTRTNWNLCLCLPAPSLDKAGKVKEELAPFPMRLWSTWTISWRSWRRRCGLWPGCCWCPWAEPWGQWRWYRMQQRVHDGHCFQILYKFPCAHALLESYKEQIYWKSRSSLAKKRSGPGVCNQRKLCTATPSILCSRGGLSSRLWDSKSCRLLTA